MKRSPYTTKFDPNFSQCTSTSSHAFEYLVELLKLEQVLCFFLSPGPEHRLVFLFLVLFFEQQPENRRRRRSQLKEFSFWAAKSNICSPKSIDSPGIVAVRFGFPFFLSSFFGFIMALPKTKHKMKRGKGLRHAVLCRVLGIKSGTFRGAINAYQLDTREIELHVPVPLRL